MAVDYATLKKGGFMRQKQKNNFSLRLRVVGGNLTAKQLAKIAEVAENFGDGYVHLTSRQSVEIPFIKVDDVENVKTYTELMPFVNALPEQKQKQQELDRQKKQFTANMSHELKTPLTSIAGYPELIESGIAKEEDI